MVRVQHALRRHGCVVGGKKGKIFGTDLAGPFRTASGVVLVVEPGDVLGVVLGD